MDRKDQERYYVYLKWRAWAMGACNMCYEPLTYEQWKQLDEAASKILPALLGRREEVSYKEAIFKAISKEREKVIDKPIRPMYNCFYYYNRAFMCEPLRR